jgi:hypothetical protein
VGTAADSFVLAMRRCDLWHKGQRGNQQPSARNCESKGPALTPGMIYQYRAVSVRKNSCPISRTEDLRGTFTVK